MVNLIVSRSQNNVIGREGVIPWGIKDGPLYFRDLTMGSALIMGRKTFETIGRPLEGCLNIIVSNTKKFNGEYMMTAETVKQAIDIATAGDLSINIIGGHMAFEEAIPLVDRMYITEVDLEVPVDDMTVFFPNFDKSEFKYLEGETFGKNIRYTRTAYIRPDCFEWTVLPHLCH